MDVKNSICTAVKGQIQGGFRWPEKIDLKMDGQTLVMTLSRNGAGSPQKPAKQKTCRPTKGPSKDGL